MGDESERDENLDVMIRTAKKLARRMGVQFVPLPAAPERTSRNRTLTDGEALPLPR